MRVERLRIPAPCHRQGCYEGASFAYLPGSGSVRASCPKHLSKAARAALKGAHVRVRLERMKGGARAQAGNDDLPLTEVVVDQVDVMGNAGVFACNYLDGSPVGIPFSATAFEEIDRKG